MLLFVGSDIYQGPYECRHFKCILHTTRKGCINTQTNFKLDYINLCPFTWKEINCISHKSNLGFPSQNSSSRGLACISTGSRSDVTISSASWTTIWCNFVPTRSISFTSQSWKHDRSVKPYIIQQQNLY